VAAETKGISEQQLLEDSNHLKGIALRAYANHRKQAPDEQRITALLPMVRKIAQRAISYIKPPLSFEDIVSAGTLGLIKAARDFEPSHEAEFETYAYIRIKGAILDELRSLSLLPSNIHRQIQAARGASRRITEQTGKPPADEELAEQLGVSIDKLNKTFESARAQQFVSIDHSEGGAPGLGAMLASPGTISPAAQLEQSELLDKLTGAIRHLPERQRQVVLLYYQQELTMKQIAEVFEITESRVSQLHASALFNLSTQLKDWKDGRQ